MKTLITTALASATCAALYVISPMVIDTAAAVESSESDTTPATTRPGPQATLVFEGTVPSVSPAGGHTITGSGGGALSKGTLTITSEGRVTTTNPVVFEVHATSKDANSSETIVDAATKTNYKVTLLNSVLTAGAAEIDNDQNKVTVNGEELTENTLSKAFSEAQASVTFANNAGFNIADVGSDGTVQANVTIMIEPPEASSPVPPTPPETTRKSR